MSLPPIANGNNFMNKEPITVTGLEKLKKELIFLKEKKDLKLFLLSQRQDHTVI